VQNSLRDDFADNASTKNRRMSEEVKLVERVLGSIRNVADYPTEGINFKDITPILANPHLCRDLLDFMTLQLSRHKFTAVAGIESRGFLFGMLLAARLELPFIPIRKKGKLPFATIHQDYVLEYGRATLEVHIDALGPTDKVLVHDDLLATGGTVEAACKLVEQLGAKVEACSFVIGLAFLNGVARLSPHCEAIYTITEFTS